MKSAMAAAAERVRAAAEVREQLETELGAEREQTAELRRCVAELEGKLKIIDHLEEENEQLQGKLDASRTAAEESKQQASRFLLEAQAAQERIAGLEKRLENAAAAGKSFEAEQQAVLEELKRKERELIDKMTKAEEVCGSIKHDNRCKSRSSSSKLGLPCRLDLQQKHKQVRLRLVSETCGYVRLQPRTE